MKLRRMILVGLLFVCILPLISCSGGIKGDEAKAVIRDFFDAVVSEDYAKAEGLFHPHRTQDPEEFFAYVEKETALDFQKGIEIQRYTGFSTAWYDSEVGGSKYELSMITKVGEQAVEFEIEIVKNDAGFGIYDLDLDTTP